MRIDFRRMALPLCLTVSSVLLFGCEDANSKAATEASETLNEQRAALSLASMTSPVPGSDEFNTARTTLKSAVSELDGLTTGTDGQQGSAKLMAANAYRQLADMDYAEAGNAARAIERSINELYEQLNAAERLSSLANAADQFAEQLNRDHLDRERANWGARLRNAEERLSSLSGPISELESANSTDTERVEELRQEANRLLRRAREMGQIAGQSTLENSVATRRSAERIEYQIAQKEAELAFDLEPQQGWADMQASGFKSILDTIDAAKSDLSQLERELNNDIIGAAQANVDQYRSALQSGTSDLKALVDSSFSPAVDAAIANIDNAVSRATSAAGKTSARSSSTSKVTKAQAQARKGEMLWAKSRLLSNHAGLMAAIANSNAAGSNASAYNSAAQTSGQAASEALNMAKSALADAQQTLSSAGAGDAIDELNQKLSLLLQAMEGIAVDFNSVGSSSSSSGASQPASRGGSGGGFNSVDDLVAFMSSLDATNFDSIKSFFDLIETDSAQVRQGMRLMNEMFDVMNDLQRAMAKIDPSGQMTNQFSQMGGAGQLFSSVSIVDQSDDVATLSVQPAVPGEPAEEMEARRGSNGWTLFVSEESFNAMTGGQGMDSDESRAQARGMVDAMRGLVEKIDSGEITTGEEAMGAFMQMMMEMAQEG